MDIDGESKGDRGVLGFDLRSYAARYRGRTKVDRLVFIAGHSKEHSADAYRMAVNEIKQSFDTIKYVDVVEKATKADLPGFSLDQAWMDNIVQKVSAQQEKLDQELARFKTNMIKESVRMAHNDQGDLYFSCGDFNNALKCYAKNQHYCAITDHTLEMHMNCIKCGLLLNNIGQVNNALPKAANASLVSDSLTQSKLACVRGLLRLKEKKYKQAAREFLDVDVVMQGNFVEVMAPEDVAVYGSLCALATFDREETKALVLDNSRFRNFLELNPPVRELVHDFYNSRYASCLQYIEALKPTLDLDIHLRDHVASLIADIRKRALLQYFSPYLSVNLTNMAESLNSTPSAIEAECAELIMEGKMQARIDSEQKILYARNVDQRVSTYKKAMRIGDQYIADTKIMILRMSLAKHDFGHKGGSRPAVMGRGGP